MTLSFAHIDPRRDAEKGATYHVDYDGERLFHDKEPIEIDFLGLQSETGKRAAAKMVKDLDQKAGRKRDASKMSVDEMLDAAAESQEARARFYAELTTGWRNVVYLDDADIDNPDVEPAMLEYSKENAFKLFSTRPWIMEGIDRFLGDKTNFTRSVGKD